jgi:eukaryotic-like serine/threonine-protein kinase
MSNLIGQSLGRYHILEQLGEGGMATVYKAYDTRLERDVAVKVIRVDQFAPAVLERILKRFEREAKALARLTHPNIVHVNDYGEQDGIPYLVMDYLPGGTLKQQLGRPMPWRAAMKLLLPVAEALDYAHSQNIIHRDVKPSNILLTQRGQPMLTDFGIAKLLESEESQTLTGTGAGVGTPEYMAPEQINARSVDGRADIYALGVVLYELITGRKPFQADTPMAVMIMQARDPLPSPRQFVPDLPEGVERVLIKALAKKPEDRYTGMGEMAAALEGLFTPGSGQSVPEKAGAPMLPGNDPGATIEQEPSRETYIQEGTRDELEKIPAVVETEAVPAAPAGRENIPPKKRTWIYWVIGAAALPILALVIWGISRLGGGATPANTQIPNPTSPPVSTATVQPTDTMQPTAIVQPTATATATLEPTATLGVGSTWARPADGMVLVYVPAGEFTMGSPEGTGEGDEHPQHLVNLDAYWIDQTEVTNAMYALCVEEGDCKPPYETKSYTHASYYGNSQYVDYPVIYVDWNQSNAYCQWAGGQLPTEAQWEKAARDTDGRTYPWGNVSPTCSLTNYGGCVGDTSKVGNYPSGASPYGALDMAGNVWEWMADWYGSYNQAAQENPQGSSSGDYRVLRGGSWFNDDSFVRSANRLGYYPVFRYYDVGFRCVRSQ